MTIDPLFLGLIGKMSEKRSRRLRHYEFECVVYLTYYSIYVICILMTIPAKKKALVASGTLNPHPEAVRPSYSNWISSTRMIALRSSTRCCAPIRSMAILSQRPVGSSVSVEKASIRLSRLSARWIRFLAVQRSEPQGSRKTQGGGAGICSREEERESRYGSWPIGDFDPGAVWHRHSSNDRDAGD